jgi:exopolysaccharide production protein ExoZ
MHFAARTETSGILYVGLCLIVAQACALAINAGFERRITTMLRNLANRAPAEAY